MSRFTKIILFLLLPFTSILSQDVGDFAFISNLLEKKEHKHSYVEETKVNKDQNEIQQSMRYLYLVYKNYFSSQDSNQCSFIPSCSDYSLAIIRKDGVVKGGIKTLDRLMRCNSLSPEKYEIDFVNRKLIDRVE